MGLMPPRLELACNPAEPEVPAAGCCAFVNVRVHKPFAIVNLPAVPGLNTLPLVVRYGANDKTANILLEVAVTVKVFLPVLYAADLIATVSTFGVTVMVVLDELLPAIFVAVRVKVTTVFAPTAGAV